MPYIDENERREFDEILSQLMQIIVNGRIMTPGDMNYLITNMCLFYIQRQGISYTALNTTVGILECVKQELYRRKIAPYEDKKIQENGDCF